MTLSIGIGNLYYFALVLPNNIYSRLQFTLMGFHLSIGLHQHVQLLDRPLILFLDLKLSDHLLQSPRLLLKVLSLVVIGSRFILKIGVSHFLVTF